MTRPNPDPKPDRQPDFEGALQRALEILERDLPEDYYYHSITHTRDEVLPAVELLAEREGIDDPEQVLLLRTAAVYHDIGYTQSRQDHETISARLAGEILPRYSYSFQQVTAIQQLIHTTRMPQSPNNLSEMILADADLLILGQEAFQRRSLDLHRELNQLGPEIPLADWYRRQLAFISHHRYFTCSAREMFSAGKQRNIDLLMRSLEDLNSQETENRHLQSILSGVPLFQNLPADEIRYLAAALQKVDLAAGELLFREGERGEHFYVVIRGQLEIIKGLDSPHERLLALRGPGEFLGEMSLLNQTGQRTASVRARDDSRLMKMTQAEFDTLLERRPTMGYEMVRALSDRLNASHVSAIQELQEKNRQLQQAYQELKAAQDQIIEKEKLDRELQLAFEIQMSILPTELPRLEDYNFGALILPARMVGGDFYDLIPLEQDKLGVVVGDVTDKGVPAALFMAQTFALIRSESEKGGSPGEILLRVNRHLLGMNARSLFVTVLFGILDRKDGSFTYARAGHELPLLLAPNGEVAVSPMDIGHPLGILESPMMDENELTIQSAGTLLLYTDGATDGRSPQNERYGMERLKAALKAGMNRSAQELCQDILADIQKHNQSAAQFDDVTLLAVTRSPL